MPGPSEIRREASEGDEMAVRVRFDRRGAELAARVASAAGGRYGVRNKQLRGTRTSLLIVSEGPTSR